jgi:TolB-like protein
MDSIFLRGKNQKANWVLRFLLCGVFVFSFGAAGCSSTDSALKEAPVRNEAGIPTRRSRQNTAEPITLKQAVLSIVEEIEDVLKQKMQGGEKLPLAVLRIDSSWNELSDWINDELAADFSNGEVVRVVDKKNTDIVRNELTDQNSGFVSNDLALRMGQETGAKYIVSGVLFEESNNFCLRIYLTEIETNLRELTPTRYVVQGDSQIQPYLERERQRQELAAKRQQEEQEKMQKAEEQRKAEEARREAERKAEEARIAKEREEARERELARVAWKKKWLYFGVRGGFSYRYYQMSKDDFDPEITEAEAGLPYELAGHIALQFSPLLALQVEGIYTYDTVDYSGVTGPPSQNFKASFDSTSIMVPVLLKLQGRPDIFKLSLFVGGYYVYRRGKMTYEISGNKTEYDYEVPFGFVAGLDMGCKIGPGVLFLDARFAIDAGKTSIKDLTGNTLALYQRMMGSFSVGYELGLFEKSDPRDYDDDY